MRSHKLRKITGAAVLLAFISMTQVACTRSSPSDADTLIVGLSNAPETLDPRFATDAIGSRITGLLFSSLVRPGPDLQLRGEAAIRWKVENDRLRFELRPGLTFSDGRAVTKDDVLFSFEQFRSSAGPFSRALQRIKKIEADYGPTGGAVTLTIEGWSATLLSDLAPVRILPKDKVNALGLDFAREPVGTGPYRLVSRTANEILLEARSGHPYAKPKTRRLLFKIVRDENTRFLKTVKGELDIVQTELPPWRIKALQKRATHDIRVYPGLSTTYLLINLRDPVLKDSRARRGLAHAINRDEIIRYKLEGMATPAASILSPATRYSDPLLRPPPFDLARAKRFLRDAGLEGKTLSLKTSNSLAAVENGRVLAHQFARAGLKPKLQSFEWGTFYDDIRKGAFQLATLKWVGVSDPDIFRTALHSGETPERGGRNRGFYVNPAFDALIEAGESIRDETARIRHYKDVQRAILEDLPIIPLWHEPETSVIGSRVSGYVPPANGDFWPMIDAEKR